MSTMYIPIFLLRKGICHRGMHKNICDIFNSEELHILIVQYWMDKQTMKLKNYGIWHDKENKCVYILI